MVFVTARLIDPAGKNLNEYSTEISGETTRSSSGGPGGELF